VRNCCEWTASASATARRDLVCSPPRRDSRFGRPGGSGALRDRASALRPSVLHWSGVVGPAANLHQMPHRRRKVRHCLLAEDRKSSGIFGQMSLLDNLFSVTLGQYSKGGFVSRRNMQRAAEARIKELRIRTPSVDQRMRLLSGGNQQKALIGRWLDAKPLVLLADEPPAHRRGRQGGDSPFAETALRPGHRRGCHLIRVAGDPGLCDRILVLHEGRLAGDFPARRPRKKRSCGWHGPERGGLTPAERMKNV